MPQAKHTDSAAGPWTNMFGIYCGQMDTAFKAADPMLRAVSQFQFEWMRLAMQRGRAWASLPAELSRCKSPVDVAAMQMRFLQTAGLNYAEGTQRAWRALAAHAQPHSAGKPNGAPRDIIEVRTDVGADEPSGRNRQAA